MAQLIRCRSKLDGTFMARDGGAMDMASARMIDMNEPVLCTYIDLDRLIGRCGLTEQQRLIVRLLMRGYSFEDIAELKEITDQSVRVQFRRAVYKIIKQNERDWMDTYTPNPTA